MRPRSNHSSARLLVERARERPNDVLMESADDGTRCSYAQMLDGALRWAAAYRRVGVSPGDAVAVMLPTSPEGYFAWLGAAWLRSLEVPINTEYRGAVLAHILNDSRASAIVMGEEHLERIAAIAADLEHLTTLIVAGSDTPTIAGFRSIPLAEFLADVEPAPDLEAPGPAEIAGVMYTSGTTGPSKGVLVPWNELSANSACVPADVRGEGYRLYSPWPVFHVTGKFALAECVDRGGSFVLRQRFRTEEFWNDIRTYRATVVVILGAVSNFLWSQPPRPDDADNSLAHVIMAPIPPHFRDFERRFGVKIHTGFGSSEVGNPTAAHHPLPNHRTCGKVVPGYEIRLVDGDGDDVPVDVAGEALVRAEDPNWMCAGYLNLPEKTAEAYADGWFHTGDALTRDADGNYYFVDRMKDCIRRRGENISSFEVENEVNSHPAVRDSAAVAVRLPDGDHEILVLVVPHDRAHVEPDELVRFLIPRMPRFMVPRYVEVVEELPKTHTGRTRKIELRERGLTDRSWDRVAAGLTIDR